MCYSQEINSALRLARKSHGCTWCGEKIEKKTKYWDWFGIVESEVTTTKLHIECKEAAAEFNSYSNDCWMPGEQPRGRVDW